MTNEVYGTIKLDVSIDVQADNEMDALLEANFKANELCISEVILLIKDMKGNLHTINVHNYNTELTTFIDS